MHSEKMLRPGESQGEKGKRGPPQNQSRPTPLARLRPRFPRPRYPILFVRPRQRLRKPLPGRTTAGTPQKPRVAPPSAREYLESSTQHLRPRPIPRLRNRTTCHKRRLPPRSACLTSSNPTTSSSSMPKGYQKKASRPPASTMMASLRQASQTTPQPTSGTSLRPPAQAMSHLK